MVNGGGTPPPKQGHGQNERISARRKAEHLFPKSAKNETLCILGGKVLPETLKIPHRKDQKENVGLCEAVPVPPGRSGPLLWRFRPLNGDGGTLAKPWSLLADSGERVMFGRFLLQGLIKRGL